ncbi:MAG: cob(I)yrinic acid a,c-diamide adenosyltransferase [Bdellovibrionales bacterium]
MMKSMRIYTKKGDKGQSSLFGGNPVSKADPRLDAYGTLDELNAVLGAARAKLQCTKPLSQDLDQDLLRIQNYLFTLGSHLAVADESMRSHLPQLDPMQTTHLEKRIDLMETELTPLKNFILPGGTSLAASLHLARTVTRRAERSVVALTSPVDPEIIVYLNRLSDFLFVAARHSNHAEGKPDIPWEKP